MYIYIYSLKKARLIFFSPQKKNFYLLEPILLFLNKINETCQIYIKILLLVPNLFRKDNLKDIYIYSNMLNYSLIKEL